jgi:uncharacterized protein (TIGR00730 family)
MADKKMLTLEEIIDEVTRIYEAGENRDNLKDILHLDILLNALKVKRDELGTLDLKVISRALSEVRYAARIFKPYRQARKVSIFGSARTPEDDPRYQMAVEFARQLADSGYMVITGAAEGIMKAGNVGAGKEMSFGVNILLPFEQAPNEIVADDPKLITFKYFFTRKLFFLMEADAVVLFPGGFGTQDEGFETLTLVQTGKAPPMPLILMELPGDDYWVNWDRFVRGQMLGRGLISEEDVSLYRICNTPEEGVEWVKSYYSTYHSMRLVHKKLVVRLQKDLTDEHVELLNDEFPEIVYKGRIEKSAMLPEEANEPEIADLPRLVFNYNQMNAARLNSMFLRINEMGKTLQGS